MNEARVDAEVVVIGGGPTGMTVAGDLARAGRDVIVIERHGQVNPASRAFAVMPRTQELLDARGLLERLHEQAGRTRTIGFFGRFQVDLSRIESPWPFVAITPQRNVDALLEDYAVAAGAQVRRGVELTGLDEDGDGVTLRVRPRGGGAGTSLRASWVVACDGARSTVRTLLGLRFPGRSVLTSAVLADLRLANPTPSDGFVAATTSTTIAFLAPYGDGTHVRSLTWDREHQEPESAPVDPAEVRDVLARTLDTVPEIDGIGWTSRFHCDERQVAAYRPRPRVLLAGDAAHVHSPFGGQGMNTGIQDAANLGWKLAAVLAGADETLLDSYHDERHPAGRRAIRLSGGLLRGASLRSRPARWLRDHLAPLALATPLGAIVARNLTEVAIRYPRSRGDHRLVGTSAAAVPLSGTTLAALQRGGAWVLVGSGTDFAPTPDTVVGAVRSDRGPALLVRPDGYIAWAGKSPADSVADWRAHLPAGRPAGQAAAVNVGR